MRPSLLLLPHPVHRYGLAEPYLDLCMNVPIPTVNSLHIQNCIPTKRAIQTCKSFHIILQSATVPSSPEVNPLSLRSFRSYLHHELGRISSQGAGQPHHSASLPCLQLQALWGWLPFRIKSHLINHQVWERYKYIEATSIQGLSHSCWRLKSRHVPSHKT